MEHKRSYLMRVLLTIDQTLNVLYFNGSQDHTISGRVGYNSLTKGGWFWTLLHWFIDTLFWFDDDHCVHSIEKDEYIKYPLLGYNVITWFITIWMIYESVK